MDVDDRLLEFGIVRRDLEARLLAEYPTIIASSYRAFLAEDNPRLALTTLIQCVFQNTMKYLALIALSEYCEQDSAHVRLNKLFESLQKPQYGHWADFLHTAQKHFREHPPSVVPEVSHFLQPRRHSKLNIVALIAQVIETKNAQTSHGAGLPSVDESRQWVEKYTCQILVWLDDMSWLLDYPLFFRTPNGGALRLMGCTPIAVACPDAVGAHDCDVFFASTERSLPAFPFFHHLPEERETCPPGLYLYNGLTPTRVLYLGDRKRFESRDADTVRALEERMLRKRTRLEHVPGPLRVDNLIERAASFTKNTLDRLASEGRYRSDLYVPRDLIESVLHQWLQPTEVVADTDRWRPGMLFRGEVGSGKSMTLFALADRLCRGRDLVVLLQGRELDAPDVDQLAQTVSTALGRSESLRMITSSLATESRRLVLLIDAVEENASPDRLLCAALGLLSTHGSLGLRLLMTVRDVPFDRLASERNVRVAFDASSSQLTMFDHDEVSRRVRRPFFTIPRVSPRELEVLFERYRRAHGIPTTLGELDEASKSMLESPMLLKLACESFRCEPLPPHISAHRVFSGYLARVLSNPMTGQTDPQLASFLNRFVDVLIEERDVRISEDAVYDDALMGSVIRSSDRGGPLDILLQEGMLTRVVDSVDVLIPDTFIRVAFDLLLELLISKRVGNGSVRGLVERVASEPAYRPLSGALTIRLNEAAQTGDLESWGEVMPFLGEDAVCRAVSSALENASYAAVDFLLRLVSTWVETRHLAALELVRDLCDFCSNSGRWTVSKRLYAAVVRQAARETASERALFEQIELTYASDCRQSGMSGEALEMYGRLKKSSNETTRTAALMGEILVLDTVDRRDEYAAATHRALEIARTTDHHELSAFALWSLGCLHEYQGEYETAITYYEEVIALSKQLRRSGRSLTLHPYCETLAPVYRWMARSLFLLPGRQGDGEKYYLEALRLDLASGTLFDVSVDWNNLSCYYFARGQLDEALAYSEKEHSQAFLFPDNPEWILSLFNRSALLSLLGRHDEAFDSARRAVELGEALAGQHDYQQFAYLALVCSHAARGDVLHLRSTVERFADYVASLRLPHDEADVVLQTARFAAALADGIIAAGTIEELARLYRNLHLSVEACTYLGLSILPSLDRGPLSPEFVSVLRAMGQVADEAENTYWIDRIRVALDEIGVTERAAKGPEPRRVWLPVPEPSADAAQTLMRPRPLRRGDRVAVVAPASPAHPIELSVGLEVIREMGLEPVLGQNVTRLRTESLFAAPLEARVEELVWAFSDASIAGIITATGGFGCAQLLPHLPYDVIRANCKILIGFSDVTALNCGVLAKSGIVSFNGPSASVCGGTEEQKKSNRMALSDALDLLMRCEPWGRSPFRQNPMIARCASAGAAHGSAVGGNLTTFACLLGTPYVPNVDGAVLFLEDIDIGGYELLRTLTQLKLAGIFDRVAGVVIGEFARTPAKSDPGEPSIDDVIVKVFSEGPPCVVGFNFSHGDTGACIPIGSSVSLDADARAVFFDAPLSATLT